MVETSITLLVLAVILSCISAAVMVRRTGRWLSLRVLAVLNYGAVYPLSGVVHLATSETGTGYFTLRDADHDVVLSLSILTVMGAVAFVIGANIGMPLRTLPNKVAVPFIPRSERRLLGWLFAALAPVALYGAIQISRFSSTLDTSRVIELPEGVARFSILSQWLVWVVSFGLMLILNTKRSAIAAATGLAAASLIIVQLFSWTGGRSVALVFLLPIVLMYAPRLRRSAGLVAVLGIIALFQYVLALSETRQLSSAPGSSVAQWIDWEWGRWSMLGFADALTINDGLRWGETFLASLMRSTQGVWSAIGLPDLGQFGTKMSEFAGVYILGQPDKTYIVPGIGAELVLNFGPVGFILGSFLIGTLVTWIDNRFSSAPTATSRLFWAYLGSVVVLRLLVSDLGSVFSYLVFGGAPIIVAAFLSGRLNTMPRSRSGVRNGKVTTDR